MNTSDQAADRTSYLGLPVTPLHSKCRSTFVAIVACLLATPASAAPGQFDTSFGQEGIAVVGTAAEAAAHFVTTDAAGRVLLTGREKRLLPGTNSSVNHELIARLLVNGRFDTTFNGTGTIRTPPIASQFLPDGIGNAFGHEGLALFPSTNSSWIAFRAQETFCPGRFCNTYLPTVTAARISAAGVSESTVIPQLGFGDFSRTQILAQPDGAYLSLSATREDVSFATYARAYLLRASAGGELDAPFNESMGGLLCQSLPANLGRRRGSGKALLQADGKILLAQGIEIGGIRAVEFNPANPHRVCITRFNADGSVDATYGLSGDLLLAFPRFAAGSYKPVTMLPLSNGGAALVLQGVVSLTSRPDVAIVWLTAQGALDRITGHFSEPLAEVTAAVMQADDKILLAGYPFSNQTNAVDYSQPRVARMLSRGDFDTSFGAGQGFAPLAAAGKVLAPNHLHLARDGSVFVAGYTVGPALAQFAVGKLQGGMVVPPAENPTSTTGGGGGGGCGITRDPRIDPMLPGLAILALLAIASRRRRQ